MWNIISRNIISHDGNPLFLLTTWPAVRSACGCGLFFRQGRRFFHLGNHTLFLLRNRVRNESGQITLMQHAELMQGAGSRHVKELCISIVGRVRLSGGVQNQHRVKFQSFGKFHRKHHDAASENGLFQIALRQGNQAFQLFCRLCRFPAVSADHGDGVEPLFLPSPADFGTIFNQTAPVFRLHHLYRIPVADDGLCGIRGKAPMLQDAGGKFRDFHRVPVAFFQNAESIPFAGKHQALKLLPVIQAVAEMDVLRYVSHDGIGAFPDTRMKHLINHHSKVLCLVDNHVMGLADYLCFLDPSVQIGQRCQVVNVKFPVRDLHSRSFFSLLLQKFPVQIINGTLPHFFPVSSPVSLQNRFSFLFRIFDALAQEFLPDLIFQAFVEHIDLALHGNRRILPDIALHRIPVHQLHSLPRHGRLSSRLIEHSRLSVLKSLHKLPGIQINAPSGNGFPLQRPAVLIQRCKPLVRSPLPAVPVRLVRRTDPVLFFIPVLIQKPDKKLLHGHLLHAVHIQIREHAGDVFQQNPVASHDVEILRPKPFLIVIEDIGDPVHGHRGFSRSGNALHDHVVVRRTADDVILLLLNGGYDLTQHRLLVFGKVLCQQIVVSHHLRIIKIQKLSFLDLIGPLSLQVNFHPSAAGHRIAAFSQTVLIIGVGDGRSPVHHNPMGSIL